MGHQVPSPYNGRTDFIILKAALIDGCQVWLMFHAFKNVYSLLWVCLMCRRQTESFLYALENFSEFLTRSLLWNRCQICSIFSIILMPSNPVCFWLLIIRNIFSLMCIRSPVCFLFWDDNGRSFLLMSFRSAYLRRPPVPPIKKACLEDQFWTKKYWRYL